MENLSDKISNPIVRGIVLVLLYIGVTIVLIPAVLYAIVKGVCTLDYYEEWFDMEYNENKSFMYDMGLLFKTVGSVVKGEGAE